MSEANYTPPHTHPTVEHLFMPFAPTNQFAFFAIILRVSHHET
jgi:hypothetical protein